MFIRFTSKLSACFLLLPLLLSLAARSQPSSRIKGSVVNDKGEPMPGVTVVTHEVQSKVNRTTTTDEKGIFSFTNLKAGVKYDFTFTYVGFENEVVKNFLINEGDNNSMLVRMRPAGANMSQVVVIGYGERKRGELTGAISSVRAADIRDQVVTSFDQALAGKLAGVQVMQTTGAPGGNVSIRVRGTASISAGNNPLFVIDGFPVSQDVGVNSSANNPNGYQQPLNPLATIDMNDIESIDVLKDAASAAIYGSRGSNGVVLITTKKGAPGKPKITYSFNGGMQEVNKRVDVMNAYDYAKEAYDSHNNAYFDAVPSGKASDPNSIRPNNPSMWTPPEVLPYVANQPGLLSTDWQKAIFRQAFFQDHTIGVSGGSENLNYYFSGNYLDQDGIIINNSFSRYSLRGHIEGKTDKLKFGINLSPSYTINNQISSEGPWSSTGSLGFPAAAGVVANALTYAPIFPIYNPDGTFSDSVNQWGYGQTSVLNPVAIASLIKDQVRNLRLAGSAFVERELIKGLKYKFFAGTDINTFLEDYYRPTTLPIQSGTLPSVAYGMSKTDQYLNWDLENTLTYNRRIGPGNFTALLGYSSQKENQYHSYAVANKYPNDDVTTLNAGQAYAVSSDLEQWSIISMIGRLQYDMKGRYFFAASMRRDGSSRFGINNKWGWFPSGSAGWILSKEDFFTGLSSYVSNLKLRASYGLTGNFSIPNYGSLAQLTSTNYILGNQAVANGLSVTTPANPNLTWENTASFDAGIDLGFLKNTLNLTFDYYNSTTSKLLLNVPTAAATGFSSQLQNIGQLTNKGVEATVSYSAKLGRDWGLDVGANIAANRNKVTQLGPGNASIIAVGGTGSAYFITQVGQPIGSYYLLVQDGIYKNQEDLNNNPHFSNSHVGDFKFKDVNGDGQLNALTDRAIVGNFQPKYTFGFSSSVRYRGLDLGVVVQGSQGNKILDLFRRYIASSEGNFNNLNLLKGRFIDSNDIGVGYINRANRIATGNNGTISTWHVEDGSFVRIKNITLGYTFAESLARKCGITSLRLYATVQNPFTFTKYSLFNPEISDRPNNALSPGEDYGSYPLARSFAAGLNLSF